MNSLFLIARLAGERIALESDRIESVVNVHEVIPAPQSDPSVAGLFALRSRVLTLIDTPYLVSGEHTETGTKIQAIIIEIAGHSYGLMVDKVEDVVPIDTDGAQDDLIVDAAWQPFVRAIARHGDDSLMILEPETLVKGFDTRAA